MRALRFAAPAFLCLALAVGVSGCGGSAKHQRTPAGTLSIYTSLPFEGPGATDARSVYDAEKLALSQAGGMVNGFKVVLKRLDDASSSTHGWDPAMVAANARTAAADNTTIAYIGELTPGSSLASVPVLDHAGILQVTPGDPATGLNRTTFARVVPSDGDEAVAQLLAMRSLGVKRLYVLRDRTTYGRDIAGVATRDAASYGVEVVDPGGKHLGPDTRPILRAIKRLEVDALLYAGSPGDSVAEFWNTLSLTAPTLKKFTSAAVAQAPSWDRTTIAARYNTFLSAPGLPSRGLPRAGIQFINDFSAVYGTQVPWTSGIFGYVAMSGVLEALYRLGPHLGDRRASVRAAFFDIANLPSALGTYSIVNGQTTFQHYFFTRYKGNGGTASFTPGVGG